MKYSIMIYPLFYYFSIAYGVIVGVLSYVILNGIPLALRKLSGDRIVPPNFDASEPWVVPPGGIVPIWMYVFLFLVLFCSTSED
jgi:adenine/guanine/hypoxanthine permease